jgi:hypothetical protein
MRSGGLSGDGAATAETLIGQDPSSLLPTVTKQGRRLYESEPEIARHRGQCRHMVNGRLEYI